MNQKKANFFLSYSLKLALVFSITTTVVTIGILFFLYRYYKSSILNHLQTRISEIGRTGIFLFQEQNFKDLNKIIQNFNEKLLKSYKNDPNILQQIQSIPPGEIEPIILSQEEHNKLYNDPSTQKIVQLLRKIKAGTTRNFQIRTSYPMLFFYQEGKERFIQWTYLLAPNPLQKDDFNHVMYILDSGMEEEDLNGNGIIDEDEKPELMGSFYNISDFPAFQNALKNKTISCNNDFISDEWGTYLSCAIPIFDYENNFLGVLALDLDVKSEFNELANARKFFFGLFIFITVGISLLSYIISKIYLKPVAQLSKASEEVTKKNFDVQLTYPSNDEFGILINNFNTMVKEIKLYSYKLEFMLDSFSRFVPKHFANILQKESILDVKEGDATEKDLAILFNDIKNFSTLAEMLSVKQTFEFLNTYFEIMNPIILKYRGFIDKFIGDEIMALFDCNPDFPLDAAIEMRLRLKEFNEKIKHLNLPTVDMGVGLNYGKVILGTVGSKERLDTTVIGDTVNTAERIQQLTRIFKTPILLTENIKNNLQQTEKYYLRRLQKVRVKGKLEPVQIYECFNVDPDEQIEKKLQTLDKYEEAIHLMHNKNFTDAILLFKEIHSINPNDFVVKIYLEKLESQS
jgi:class 3 adenylate cyclase/HAMP domain-containing protein